MRVPGHQRKFYTWRWTAALAGLAVFALALVMALVVVPALRVRAAATVTTLASATISADTAGVAPGSGVYTALTGPVVQEGAVGDIATGTIVLDAPTDFEFNPTATVIVSVSPTTANATKIAAPGGCGAGSSSASATVAADKITIEACAASSSGTVSRLTWSGIRVRPKTGPAAPVTNEAITYSGAGTINGITTGVDPLGLLTETNGAPATVTLPPLAATGPVNTVVGPWTANVQDQFGNPAVGAPVSWSITSVPSGATCQQLIAPQINTAESGNATTRLKLGHLAGNYQLSVTSGAAGPATDVASATGGPGAPCAPVATPTFTPTSTPVFTATPTLTPSANRFYGYVTLNGSAAPAGTYVTASIGGYTCGTTTVDASSNYVIDVASSATTGCGYNGATVNFTVASCPANSGTWYTGATMNLGLTASCYGTPTPTLTPGANRFYGYAYLNGTLAAAGTYVTASIGGYTCGTTTVDASSNYVIDVASSATTGCGYNGATVNFTVASCPANSGTWYTGATTNLGLTASCYGTPTPTPTTGAMQSVTLVGGACNPVASSYANATPIATIAAAVSPSGILISIWKFAPGTSTWLGYSPQFPAQNDLPYVNRLDAFFICVSSAGTWSRPLI